MQHREALHVHRARRHKEIDSVTNRAGARAHLSIPSLGLGDHKGITRDRRRNAGALLKLLSWYRYIVSTACLFYFRNIHSPVIPCFVFIASPHIFTDDSCVLLLIDGFLELPGSRVDIVADLIKSCESATSYLSLNSALSRREET